MKNIEGVVKISFLEVIALNFYSLVWGIIFFIKRFVKKFWEGDVKDNASDPPDCLINDSLGQHWYIKLKGVKFHYVAAGDKKLPLLILLHGFPDCWISWRHQIPILSKNFRVIALDMKGFGESDKPANIHNYYINKLVPEFNELIRKFGYRKCVIIGHDIGALFGWFIVHTYPDLVTKFVAISAPHPNLYWSTMPSNGEFNLRWVQICQLPNLPELKALDDDLIILKRVYPHLVKSNANEKYLLDAYKYVFSRKEDWTGAINYFRTLPYWRLNASVYCQVSTLLIVGNKDESVLMESVIQSADYVEKSSVKVIKNAFHFPHQEHPEEVNKVLSSFLIGNAIPPVLPAEKQATNGLVNRMFGAVSNTVKYGNSMFDVVHKTTNGLTARALGYDS